MKNSLNREVPDGMNGFLSSDEYKNNQRILLKEKDLTKEIKFFERLEDAFDFFNIQSNQTFSFHHHLRNGDEVINQVCDIIQKRNLKNISLAPSSIFPSYIGIKTLIEEKRIKDIYTSYLNGESSTLIQKGYLSGLLHMQTHGGRARAIESKELSIDFAFLATPSVDNNGNGSGAVGPSSCGTLGYAISDLHYAKKVILVTDHLVEKLDTYQFDGRYVDGVVVVQSIGRREGIVSGTTKITRDPIGLKIAKYTAFLLDKLNIIKPGFSMQTGAGGTSLAVADFVRNIMIEKQITGSFASGGITSYYVKMLEDQLFDKLFDVQCFDLEAVLSYEKNNNHVAMSASEYGNPYEKNPICNQLDFVILGATEIDLNYNVNVTTDSFGHIIGGSGGHSDIAYGSKCTVIVSQLIKSRLSIVKEEVYTISTPGEDIDIFVCEYGFSINPKRHDLLDKVNRLGLKNYTMNELLDIAYSITGVPMKIDKFKDVIGVVEYRDGSIIDSLYGEICG